MARKHGSVAPVLQLLAYPMLDDRTRTSSHSRHRMWGARSNRFGWDSYLGRADPELAVPARRDDLSGVAPAWIGVGTCDLFHDEAVSYAQRLMDAAVPCKLDVVPGAFHGFDLMAPEAAVSRRFFYSQCEALSTAFDANA